MGVNRPPLLPLFRSETQLLVLGRLFCGPGGDLMVSELADQIAVPLSTVAREVHRLVDAGVLVATARGRSLFVGPNWDLPWASALAALLDQTIGPIAVISEVLSELEGVEQAFVFGSWAARAMGRSGAAPADVDLVVVASSSLSEIELARGCRAAEDRIGIEVKPLRVEPADWEAPEADSFLESLKAGPLVEVPVLEPPPPAALAGDSHSSGVSDVASGHVDVAGPAAKASEATAGRAADRKGVQTSAGRRVARQRRGSR